MWASVGDLSVSSKDTDTPRASSNWAMVSNVIFGWVFRRFESGKRGACQVSCRLGLSKDIVDID